MTMTFSIKGRLTRDPEFHPVGTDSVRARLGIASDRWTRNATGEAAPVVEFYDVTVFGEVAEQLREAHTGDSVSINGDVRPTRYERDGTTQYTNNFIGKTVSWETKQAVKEARAATREYAKAAALGTEWSSQEHFDANFRR